MTSTATTVRNPLQLEAVTEVGRRFVILCAEHAADFATRADQHDRDGSFPVENIAALQGSGVMAATVPAELGGMGLTSLHDLVVGFNRLGRGDGSTAIAAAMHIGGVWSRVRAWRALRSAGMDAPAGGLEAMFREIVAGDRISYAAGAEPGGNAFCPMTEARRVDGGWLLNGRKSFGTLSPVATHASVSFRFPDGNGGYRVGLGSVAIGSAGVEILDNWNALGMRASGSHDTVFTDCFLADGSFVDIGPWGRWSTAWLVVAAGLNLVLVGVMLGIAEAAHERILATLTTRRKLPDNRLLAERSGIQHQVAESEIDLAAARAMLGRSAIQTGDFLDAHPAGQEPEAEFHVINKGSQCTKFAVTRLAITVVDRALTLSGGAGYMADNPLSRMYRDVRAGPFMQGYSANEAHEYIAKIALGLDPSLL